MSFGYEGHGGAADVSFTVPAGSTFAILGGTGSGKSTLVHLLDRLYDLGEGQGAITIGGATSASYAGTTSGATSDWYCRSPSSSRAPYART